MTLTNEQIVALYEGLRAARSVVLPIQVAYTLLRDQQNLWAIYKDIFNERENIQAKYNINDNPSAEDVTKANAAWEKLALQKHMVELQSVKLNDLTDVKISMEALEALMPIISGEE